MCLQCFRCLQERVKLGGGDNPSDKLHRIADDFPWTERRHATSYRSRICLPPEYKSLRSSCAGNRAVGRTWNSADRSRCSCHRRLYHASPKSHQAAKCYQRQHSPGSPRVGTGRSPLRTHPVSATTRIRLPNNEITRNKSIVPSRTMHTGRILSHERPLRGWSY